jgi:Fe-Mn family superoxide dismutase
MIPFSRRQFISGSTKLGLSFAITSSAIGKSIAHVDAMIFMPEFKQTPLPYAYNALEPLIDAMTMELHYSKHAAAYCKNLNDAVKAEQIAETDLSTIIANIDKYSVKVRNNGGGHFNHEFFWNCLCPVDKKSAPDAFLLDAIVKDFGSMELMKKQFSDAAKSCFGSGWAWLVKTKEGKLAIGSTPNQDNPLMPVAQLKGAPILALDVWEHAYYLKYQNKRADYIEGFWKLVDWKFVSKQFQKTIK